MAIQLVVAPIVLRKAKTTVYLKPGSQNGFQIFSKPYANHPISCYVLYRGVKRLARKYFKGHINEHGEVNFEFTLPAGITEVKGIYCEIEHPNNDPFEFFIPAVLED